VLWKGLALLLGLRVNLSVYLLPAEHLLPRVNPLAASPSHKIMFNRILCTVRVSPQVLCEGLALLLSKALGKPPPEDVEAFEGEGVEVRTISTAPFYFLFTDS